MLGEILGGLTSVVGGVLGSSEKKKDRKLQKDAMQHGIQWRVEDALRSGVHPLYALGAPTFSPSPVSAGGYDLGQGLADAGQSIGRAVSAYQSKPDRNAAILGTLGIERAQLENDLLRSQIRQINQPGNPPGISRVPVRGDGILPGDVNVKGGKLVFPGSGELPLTPNRTEAQRIQDRYGDWVEGAYGVGLLAEDAFWKWLNSTKKVLFYDPPSDYKGGSPYVPGYEGW